MGRNLLEHAVDYFERYSQGPTCPGGMMNFNVAGWLPKQKTFQHVAIRMRSGVLEDGRDLHTSPWLLLDKRLSASGEVKSDYPVEIQGLAMCETEHAGMYSKRAYDFDARVGVQYFTCKTNGLDSRASVDKVILTITYLRPAGVNGVQASFLAALPPTVRPRL